MNRGRWFFLRAYLLVVLLVVVVGVGLEALLMQRDEQALLQREKQLVQGGFLYAELLLNNRKGGAPDNLDALLRRELSLPAAIHPLADFATAGAEFEQLARGEIIQLFDSRDRTLFYRRLGDSDSVLELGPVPEPGNDRAEWIVPLFYGLIALAVFLWIRPLMRDLDSLQNAAQAFGEQDFSVRTDLPRGSWLLPLGEALNSMAQRIEWLLQSHREMTHAVSHELRTPLARLRFGLEMLAAGGEDERGTRVAAMNEDIDELNELVEEMLRYAELEQSNLSAHSELLESDWLLQYIGHYNNHQPRVPLAMRGEAGLPAVYADERLLRRALDNLVGNAQRFARRRIELALRVEHGECLLSVSDDGPGIPAEQRDAVLSAYVRLENKSASGHRGFGLGLAIVKRIMDLHRGRIEIASARGSGAICTLVWPNQTPAQTVL